MRTWESISIRDVQTEIGWFSEVTEVSQADAQLYGVEGVVFSDGGNQDAAPRDEGGGLQLQSEPARKHLRKLFGHHEGGQELQSRLELHPPCGSADTRKGHGPQSLQRRASVRALKHHFGHTRSDKVSAEKTLHSSHGSRWAT